MFPPAPPLFSTTTGCPHVSASLAPIARENVSAMPPTANGTTILIGLLGYAAVCAATGAPIASAKMPARAANARFISLSSSMHCLPEQLVEIVLRNRPRIGRGRVILHRAFHHARNHRLGHAHGAQR